MLPIIDIKDMPGYNPAVTDGVDSVSRGFVFLRQSEYCANDTLYPHCKIHGAMLRVSKDGIWRCGEFGCHSGCYYPLDH